MRSAIDHPRVAILVKNDDASPAGLLVPYFIDWALCHSAKFRMLGGSDFVTSESLTSHIEQCDVECGEIKTFERRCCFRPHVLFNELLRVL